MSYNLNDNVNDTWEFQVNGISFEMAYPLVENIDVLKEILDREVAEKDPAKKQEIGKEALDYLYSFITPVKEDSPQISDVMSKVNIKVFNNFNKMVKAEFGVQ